MEGSIVEVSFEFGVAVGLFVVSGNLVCKFVEGGFAVESSFLPVEVGGFVAVSGWVVLGGFVVDLSLGADMSGCLSAGPVSLVGEFVSVGFVVGLTDDEFVSGGLGSVESDSSGKGG